MTTLDRVLKSSALLALSSGVVAVGSIVRYKAVALGGGAEALGVVGVVLGLTTLVTALSGLGIPSSAVRLLAASRDSRSLDAVAAVLRWKWIGVATATCVTVGTVFGLEFVTGQSLVGQARVAAVICAAATVAAAFDGAILNGLQEIRVLVAASVTGAAMGTIATVAVALVGTADQTIAASLAATPLALAVANAVGRRRVARLPKRRGSLFGSRDKQRLTRQLVGLGLALLVGTLLSAAAQLIVRSAVARTLGLEAAGLHQATWAIAFMYLGFVLTALGAEYFPRLTSQIENDEETRNTVELQTVLSLQLATPCIVVMILLAERILEWLYTEDFTSSALLLRMFLLGDFVKVAAWAIVFLFAAKNWRVAVVVTESVFAVVYAVLAILLIPVAGLMGVGIAWSSAYAVYLAVTLVIAQRANFEALVLTVVTALAPPLLGAVAMVCLLSSTGLLPLLAATCIAIVLVVLSTRKLLRLRNGAVHFHRGI